MRFSDCYWKDLTERKKKSFCVLFRFILFCSLATELVSSCPHGKECRCFSAFFFFPCVFGVLLSLLFLMLLTSLFFLRFLCFFFHIYFI